MTLETAAPPAEPVAPAPATRSRTRTGASMLPLAAIAIGFFVPTLRGCERMESPAENFFRSPDIVTIVYPYFVAAAVLMLVAAALLGGPEPLRKVLVGLSGLELLGSVPSLVLVALDMKWLAVCAGIGLPLVVVAAVLWNRGRLRPGWDGWPPLLASVGVASLVSPAGGFLAGAIIEDIDRRDGVSLQAGPGAYLFLAAAIALALLGAWGSRRPRDQSV